MGLAGCYQPLSGLKAGQWDCYDYPPGEVIATVLGSVSITATASLSAATSPPSATYPTSTGVSALGEAPCGTGCMFVGDECCPSGQGSCSFRSNCVIRTDGLEGCCPAWAKCNDTVAGATSSPIKVPPSSSGHGVGRSQSSSYATSTVASSTSPPASASQSSVLPDTTTFTETSSSAPSSSTPAIRPTSSKHSETNGADSGTSLHGFWIGGLAVVGLFA